MIIINLEPLLITFVPGNNISKTVEEIRGNTILPPVKMLSMKNPSYTPLGYLLKITENIINNPGEAKYRLLKLTNSAVQNKLLAYDGVKEFLEALGFQVRFVGFISFLVQITFVIFHRSFPDFLIAFSKT